MSNLYELTKDMLGLQEFLEGDLEGFDEETIRDTIEAVQGTYEDKLEAYCKVIRNLEADCTALKNEENRLKDKRRSLEHNIDRLKRAMFDSMKTTGTTKVKGTIFTVSIQKNGGKLPVIVDVDIADLPDELVRVTEAPDLDAITKLLEQGESKYAHFGERGESLRIK